MRSGGGEVGITRTSKNTQVIVGRRIAEKDEVRCCGVECFGG